jgi:anti-sigma regulatory factor (Ser/Thr protein kinase)
MIHFFASRDGREVVVAVVDEGEGFSAVLPITPPSLDCARGRGLFLMQELSDRLDIASTNGGTTVRMSKRVA